MALAASIGPTARVACIDSEHGSASVYAGDVFTDGEQAITMDVMELGTYSPSEYAAAIEAAGRAKYDVLIIDSLSHAWEGLDGALEQVDKKGGNRFTAWKDVTPMHRRMVEAILSSPCHVIATMRSKTEYVLEEDEKGKKVPRKIGVAPIQRPGMEYEFDVYGSMDWSHVLHVTKTRCRAIDGAVAVKPGALFIQPVIDWLNTGTGTVDTIRTPSPLIRDAQLQQIVETIAALGWTRDRVNKELPRRYETDELHKLTADQADNLAAWLAAQLKGRGKKATTAAPAPEPTPPEPAAQAELAQERSANGKPILPTLVASVEQPMTDIQRDQLMALLDDWLAWNIDAYTTNPKKPMTEDEATEYTRGIFKTLLTSEYGVEKTSQLDIRRAAKLIKWLTTQQKMHAEQDATAAAGQNPF